MGGKSAVWMDFKEPQTGRKPLRPLHRRTADLHLHRHEDAAVCRRSCQRTPRRRAPARIRAGEKRGSRTGPYTTNSNELSYSGVQRLIKNAIKQTERYRLMKQAGASDEEIDQAFHTPYQMDIFAYVRETKRERPQRHRIVPGSKSVTMTPYDSLMYMKTILRTGLMSMDPVTGYVKAYVGGPDFTHFQYDMVSRGKRQIGSTAKPFLYTLAMEQDFTPAQCSATPSRCSATGRRATQPCTRRRDGRSSLGADQLQQLDIGTSCQRADPGALANKMRMFGITGYIDAHPRSVSAQ